MNPISFKRVILSWRAKSMMEQSIRFYQYLERRYGLQLLRPVQAQRVHASNEERSLWKMRQLEEPVGSFIGDPIRIPQVDAPFGSIGINGCYWLNTQDLLEAHRSAWLGADGLIEAEYNGITERVGTSLRVSNVTTSSVIHCTGAFHSVAGLVPVQGEVLTVHIEGLEMDHSIHRSCFLIPLGNNNYRLGSTFNWKTVWGGASEEGQRELVDKLKKLIDLPLTIVDHWAGTRPTTKDRRPLVGPLPNRPGEFLLNGLGSRGAMVAPWCAAHLADQLENGVKPDSEVDPMRFL
jgi:glycine/D-amino acid oxidase-like deaminating enzyme